MFIPQESYNSIKKNNFNIDTTLLIKDLPVALINSLRRVLLSNIPISTFDDTWDNREEHRSIHILKNTSSLHNEFISHRLSLVPLLMTNDNLKILSKFNTKRNLRVYSFKNNMIVPKFRLKIKNNNSTRIERKSTESLQITTQDLEIVPSEDESIILPTIDTFIKPDPYTNDYIILNVLKPNILNDDQGEELDLIAKPRPGIGLVNSRFTPVGTVSYSFVTDNAKADNIFQEKIKYKNKERMDKGVKELSDSEIISIKNSYNLLDKYRVYLKNEFGEPNQFNLRIESIGFLDSEQLFYDSLYTLQLMISDVINSISFNNVESTLNIITSDKLKVENTTDTLDGFLITIVNENHTLGNLISEYYKLLYSLKNSVIYDLFSFSSYRMPHPLTEEIELKLKFNPLLKDTELIKLYNKLSNDFSSGIKSLSEFNDSNKKELLIMIFVKTLSIINNDINNLKEEWSVLTKITKPSYDIGEDDDYFNKYSELGSEFNVDAILKKSKPPPLNLDSPEYNPNPPSPQYKVESPEYNPNPPSPQFEIITQESKLPE